jgi:hypothetical protein
MKRSKNTDTDGYSTYTVFKEREYIAKFLTNSTRKLEWPKIKRDVPRRSWKG